MPASVTELFDGRTETVSSKSTAEVPYLVTDAEDEADVISSTLATAPSTYSGLILRAVEITERLDAETWKVKVRYGPPEPGEEGEPAPAEAFSFDTGGGTQHITQSLETLDGAGAVSSELNGAIGFDGDNVAGVDIVVPVFNFSETHYFTDGEMTEEYKQTLCETTGKVNSDSFKGYDAGEVLFMGASGSRQGTGASNLWEVTFKFAVKKNQGEVTVGGLGPVSVDGWNYLWVQYEAAVDSAVKLLIKKPSAIYVEEVYDQTAFSALGLDPVVS